MGSIPQLSMLKGLASGPTKKMRLHRLLEANASRPAFGSLTALIYTGSDGETVKMSLSELDSASNRLARAILGRTGGREANGDGERLVGVGLPPSEGLLPLLLAVWKAGAAYLPLDHSAPPDRVAHILAEAKPILLITDSAPNGVHSAVNAVSFSSLQKEALGMPSQAITEDEELPTMESSTAIVLYTSGSTGIPKGVRLSHSAILNRLQWQWREFPYGPEERICVFKTALTFVDSVSEIWGPLLCPQPRCVLIVPKHVTKDPARLITLLETYKIERLVLVPTLLRAILMYLNLSKVKMLQRLKLWVCSGETLVVSLATQFIEYFNTGAHCLCNFYGSTEIMGDVSYHIIRNTEDINYDGKVPIGIAIDNTALYLLDKHLRIVPLGETGELYVAGRNLATGYVNGRDAFRFLDNPHVVDPEFNRLFRTGDYAKIVKGTLIYEGRSDSQVKVRGHRVDLSEIDSALNKIKGVQKGIVLCYKPGEINQTILAFVLVEGSTINDREIEILLESSLPPYAIPQVIVVDRMPLLVNGKIDRQYLLRTYEQLKYKDKEEYQDIDYTGIPSEKLIPAECLFKTIASVLGASVKGKISESANFYSLGGNSLNSVYTVTKLRDQGFIISITDFISASTLGEVMDKMFHEDSTKQIIQKPTVAKLTFEMMQKKHKNDVYEIIADSFYEKSDLERWIQPLIPRAAYYELMDSMWEPLIEKDLSFVVKNKIDEVIAVSMNFDAHDEPDVSVTSDLTIVFNFLEYLEGPIRDKKLPQGKGKILHSFMAGTQKKLSAPENVEVMEFMESEILKLAKRKSFIGIFTTNSSPLTQQLGVDVFNYDVMHDYQVNQYVAADGTRPFKEAPYEQRAICCYKSI